MSHESNLNVMGLFENTYFMHKCKFAMIMRILKNITNRIIQQTQFVFTKVRINCKSFIFVVEF